MYKKSSEPGVPGMETQFQKITCKERGLVWNVKGILAYFLQGFVFNKHR